MSFEFCHFNVPVTLTKVVFLIFCFNIGIKPTDFSNINPNFHFCNKFHLLECGNLSFSALHYRELKAGPSHWAASPAGLGFNFQASCLSLPKCISGQGYMLCIAVVSLLTFFLVLRVRPRYSHMAGKPSYYWLYPHSQVW